MSKNYENNPEQARIIKEKLFQKYPAIFEKYKMDRLSETQVCNFVQFLAQECPEKYGKTNIDAEDREVLRRIYVVIDQEKDLAMLINIKNGKLPEGEMGVYHLQNQEFDFTNKELRKTIREQIKKYTKNVLTPQEEEKMIDEITAQNLEDMAALATKGLPEEEIEEKVYHLVDQKIDDKNRENGVPKEERIAIEEQSGHKKNEPKQEGEKEVPEDVAKACIKLGVVNIKWYFYVNAKELADKIDSASVNRDGGKVLILEVENSSNNLTGPDRYFGMQEDKMVLYGTQDKEMEQVTERSGVPPVDGKLIEPLKKDNPTYVEFTNSEGMEIQEKLEESMNISVQNLENYKKEVEKMLEQYAKRVYEIIEEKFLLNDEEKVTQLVENNLAYNKMNVELAKKYGINLEDVKAINLQTTEYTKEKSEEILGEELEDDEYIHGYRSSCKISRNVRDI